LSVIVSLSTTLTISSVVLATVPNRLLTSSAVVTRVCCGAIIELIDNLALPVSNCGIYFPYLAKLIAVAELGFINTPPPLAIVLCAVSVCGFRKLEAPAVAALAPNAPPNALPIA
jgi:hypothetical protein